MHISCSKPVVLLLSVNTPTELLFEPSTRNYAVFCKDLDVVMYMGIRPATQSFQVKTFFDFGKNHTKMYEKQKRKCIEIQDIDTGKSLKELLFLG